MQLVGEDAVAFVIGRVRLLGVAEPIAATLFHRVHGTFGGGKEGLVVGCICGEAGDADADAGGEFAVVEDLRA